MNTSEREQASILVSTWARDTSTFATLEDAITAALEAKEREVDDLKASLRLANENTHRRGAERDALKAEVERLRTLADKQAGYLKLYEDSDNLVGHADVDQLKEERDEARRLLGEAKTKITTAARVFRSYEQMHRLSGELGKGKAEANADRAIELEQFIENPALARVLGEVGK